MNRTLASSVPLALVVVGAVLVLLGVFQLIDDGDGRETVAEPGTVTTTARSGASTEPIPADGNPDVATSPTTTIPVGTPATTQPTTTSPATTTTTTTTTMPPETPEEFLAVLISGLRGDAELLVSRLNQATIDIYGAEQCLQTLSGLLDPDTDIEIREIGETGPWDYVIDGIVTPLEDVLFVEVERFVGGQTIIQELHWKLVDGTWTWFSDCGEPLGG